MLLHDERHLDHRYLAWSLRALRVRLTERLALNLFSSGGHRRPQAAGKTELAQRMRRALGLDLPVDREPTPPS